MLRGAFLLAAVAAALAAPAQAANQPHPTLDAIASEVAGHAVSVWCETDEAEWIGLAGGSADVSGFVKSVGGTIIPIAHLSPGVCLTLTAALRDVYSVALHSFAGSLLTLLHESVHLRGVIDEGETDCAALALVRDYATRYFNYAELTTVDRVVRRWVRVARKVWVERNGRRVRIVRLVRVRVEQVETVQVPDPELTALVTWALTFHRAKPPEYQGNC